MSIVKTSARLGAWRVADLFSGAGGMSFGFHSHPGFRIVGAVDAELGKPSSGVGKLGCNRTYELNMGIAPEDENLGDLAPWDLRSMLEPRLEGEDLAVLLACPPCTGFSRTLAHNHLVDDPRNSLVARVASYALALRPAVVVLENARELLVGRFRHHYEALARSLGRDYQVSDEVHFLDRFGLPQRRERAIVLAVRRDLEPRSIDDLWNGYGIDPKATHVRRAIWSLPATEAGEAHPLDSAHVSPSFSSNVTRRRLDAIPRDGGSWADLARGAGDTELLTPAMKRLVASKDWGSHPDVYGRLWWDRPSVTVKRECAHIGNGRYSHPEQNRLCTVRELAILQGFPTSYQFSGPSLANQYRHVGDAVPPLFAYQLAHLCAWILSGVKPPIESLILPDTHLSESDIERRLA